MSLKKLVTHQPLQIKKKYYKMKKIFLNICFTANILLYASFFVLFIAVIFDFISIKSYILSENFSNIKTVLSLLVLTFWIYNLVIWSKHDKKIGRFLMLFFLIGIYTPFYYLIALKNKWI